jgi:hypothetical protein
MQHSRTNRSYKYSAYGLTIKSDICLPELNESAIGEDVEVCLSGFSDRELDANLKDSISFDRPGCSVRVSADAVCYSWDGIGTILIQNGRKVFVSPASGDGERDLAPFVTGAVLGHLLEQRGLMVLHGSAVMVNGKGIAFLGEKGSGKSTFALHFQKRGYGLLTDDLVPIAIEGGEVLTVSGFPQIKLWLDAAESAGLDPSSTPRFSKFIDKRSYKCPDGFSRDRVRLGAIYILTEAAETKIERLELSNAFIELTRHAYLGRYSGATGRKAEHFKKCGSIVGSVPIFRLHRPHDFDLLPQVFNAVVAHTS